MTKVNVTPTIVKLNVTLANSKLKTEKYETKLTAKEQRKLFFGKYLFGRKSLRLFDWGIKTYTQVAYGQDFSTYAYTWEKIAKMINEDLKVDTCNGTLRKA